MLRQTVHVNEPRAERAIARYRQDLPLGKAVGVMAVRLDGFVKLALPAFSERTWTVIVEALREHDALVVPRAGEITDAVEDFLEARDQREDEAPLVDELYTAFEQDRAAELATYIEARRLIADPDALKPWKRKPLRAGSLSLRGLAESREADRA